MSDKQTFAVTVESPHGKQAIESFRHFLGKVSDEAKERWGITISIERIETTDMDVSTEDFE
jgi:hypothetical protein